MLLNCDTVVDNDDVTTHKCRFRFDVCVMNTVSNSMCLIIEFYTMN